MSASTIVPGILYRVKGPQGFDQLISGPSSFAALESFAQ
jgi:hypothetical protein